MRHSTSATLLSILLRLFMKIDDNFYMSLALEEAWKYQGLTYPNPAVGAVIVIDDRLLAIKAHKKAGAPHAEVLACQEAYFQLTNDKAILELTDSAEIHTYLTAHHNDIFKNATIYTTLEPCNHYGKTPPCSLLLKTLKFKSVVIGSRDTGEEAKGGALNLPSRFVMSEKCDQLLEPFRRWSEGQFIFFKYAQNLNGVIDGGYISSSESLAHVHALRDKCDLLIIGGNTVRADRPTLDARLVAGKAPDILIYSHEDNFDREIPLFGVPNRKVVVSNNLHENIKEYKFIMVEGGSGMLEATKDIVSHYLIYQASKTRIGKVMEAHIDMEFLNIQESIDIKIWAKKQ